uniref:AAA+ ATPase domain-containing protein n=1 Tax=viral metagenome TaxID=1070528 RepID=A0A6C0CRG5_9ZZZZ
MAYNLRIRSITKHSYNDPPPDEEDELSDEEDPDYDPEMSEEYETEDETEDEIINFTELGRNYRTSTSILLVPLYGNNNQDKKQIAPIENHKISYNKEEKDYLKKLDQIEQKKLIDIEIHMKQIITKESIPLRFKILTSCLDDSSKFIILNKLEQFQKMNEYHGEYFKLRNWLNNVCQLPIQKYCTLPVNYQSERTSICNFINHIKTVLDDTVYGHLDAKSQFLRIIAQWISNPKANGHCIGIVGPPGIGKTSFIKDGISKALSIPFAFVALGGASDGSFLEGHSFTYEGSSYGKISEMLIRTQCMNPIIFFDELDKISNTKKGEEIIGILTHLTDTSQNEKFNDRYFGEIDLDLSRALIVFSYNDESLINPILKDRLITINVKGYQKYEKYIIAKDYLIPKVIQNYGFKPHEIEFPKEIIYQIMEMIPNEEGVRNLKRGIECIVSWINIYRYLPKDETLTFPFIVTYDFIQKYIQINKQDLPQGMYL